MTNATTHRSTNAQLQPGAAVGPDDEQRGAEVDQGRSSEGASAGGGRAGIVDEREVPQDEGQDLVPSEAVAQGSLLVGCNLDVVGGPDREEHEDARQGVESE